MKPKQYVDNFLYNENLNTMIQTAHYIKAWHEELQCFNLKYFFQGILLFRTFQ